MPRKARRRLYAKEKPPETDEQRRLRLSKPACRHPHTKHVREEDGTITCYWKTRLRGAGDRGLVCQKCHRSIGDYWTREDWDFQRKRLARHRKRQALRRKQIHLWRLKWVRGQTDQPPPELPPEGKYIRKDLGISRT